MKIEIFGVYFNAADILKQMDIASYEAEFKKFVNRKDNIECFEDGGFYTNQADVYIDYGRERLKSL